MQKNPAIKISIFIKIHQFSPIVNASFNKKKKIPNKSFKYNNIV